MNRPLINTFKGELLTTYLEWLSKRCNFKRKNYSKLLIHLLTTPFFYSERIIFDENRAIDGINLRDDFLYENGIMGINFSSADCSVLEMLVALAIRIDSEYIGDPSSPRPDIMFWEMIGNLGLDWFDNSKFDTKKVDEIVDNWLFRRIDKLGNGGIFPLKMSKNCQKTIEIWKQMQEYIGEKW